jgi:ATP-dependent exoDNAse (exonuclease V) beta subunit
VIIDRLARDPQGTLWIIDYKTARNEDGDLDAFFKAEVERYRGQVQRYGRALAGLPAFAADRSSMQLGLYFVAYGKLVTVPTAA